GRSRDRRLLVLRLARIPPAHDHHPPPDAAEPVPAQAAPRAPSSPLPRPRGRPDGPRTRPRRDGGGDLGAPPLPAVLRIQPPQQRGRPGHPGPATARHPLPDDDHVRADGAHAVGALGAGKVRWGIIGTGHMASEFARALRRLPGAELIAVGSRDEARASAFAREAGAARGHHGYEALAADPDLD